VAPAATAARCTFAAQPISSLRTAAPARGAGAPWWTHQGLILE
jgi:hypothetical protein